MLASDIRNIHEAYHKIYAPKFETILDEMTNEQVDELTDDLIEEIVEEVFYECLEEGYELDDIENVLVESLDNSITALNEQVLMELNPYAPAGSRESGEYNKATTKSKKSAKNAEKRAETIERVKGVVKKVGSTIKQKAAGAAVSAYAAGKMAKSAAKTAGKAALSGAGEVAGKAVKYAKKAGQAVSSGYKKGSEDSGEEESTSSSSTSTSSRSQTQPSSSSESSGGSIRRAAGSLLKRGIKKVLGLGARAVAGTARGVHSLADKAAKRLGEETIAEDPVQDYRDMKRADENRAGMRGPEFSHDTAPGLKGKPQPGSATTKPQPRSREFSHGNQGGSRPLKSVVKGGLTMSYEPEGDVVDEQGPALPGENRPGTPKAPGGRPHLPGEKQTPAPKKPTTQLQLASYEPEDIYDLVMEYLLDNGHADSVSEAHYIMSQLDENAIENIFEETTTEKLARIASKKADEPGAKTQYKPEGPGFKHPRSKAAIMNQIAGRAKNRVQHGVDSQYASQSEQPKRGGRGGRGSKTDRPATANMPNPNRKPKG